MIRSDPLTYTRKEAAELLGISTDEFDRIVRWNPRAMSGFKIHPHAKTLRWSREQLVEYVKLCVKMASRSA